MKTEKEVDLTLQQFKKLIRKIEQQGLNVKDEIVSSLNGFNIRKPFHVKFINVNK